MRYLFFVLFCLLLGNAKATHIVGGEMGYKYLGNNQYRIRLDLYIDCQNGNPSAIQSDATAYIGVFNGQTRNMIGGYPKQVNRQGPKRVVKTNYNCIVQAPNACVDQYWYEVTFTLPPITGGYYISFQRCCRNGSINNLVDPGGTGANYWTLIPDARTLSNKKENNSAVFKELPPNFLCTNTPLKFDHSAIDDDGDSLVYELFRPYTGGTTNAPRPDQGANGDLQMPPFSQITWGAGYIDTNPINGNPPLQIDSKTGYLTLTPTKTGQFVVGILVKEYRNGQLIGTTRRDYQFNVQSCVIDVVASYFVPTFICGYQYKFQNKSTSAQRYHWDFGIDSLKTDTSNLPSPTFTFPHAGKFKVKLYAYKNKCLDSFLAYVTVIEPLKPKLPADTIICPGGSVKLKSNIKAEAYKWSTGQTTDSIITKLEGWVYLDVYSKICYWRDSMKITIDRAIVNALGDTTICSNDPINRDIYGAPGMAKYTWSNGATTRITTVKKTGKYYLIGETVNKCKSIDSVTVSQYSPVKVVVGDTTVCPSVVVTFDSKINTGGNTSVVWSDGASGRTANISSPGLYWVKVTVGLCSTRDTFKLTNFPYEFKMGNDLRYCEKIDTTLTITLPNVTQVVWNREITGPVFRLTAPGKVVVELHNSYGCPEKDSIDVKLFPNPIVDLGPDTSLCLSETPTLDAGPGMISYLWNTGATSQKIIGYDSGLYWVKVKDPEGCVNRDSVNLNKRKDAFPSIIFMPNAFTPNGDGRNDMYPMNQYMVKGSLYNVKLFNRWGEKIAEFTNPDMNWDGNINGKPAPEGVYIFMAYWIGCDNEKRSLQGNFTLLR
ncbi:MAG: T9SS type B sorting domain-containing protein [Bacteroidia bacterium]|jgi:gliding motility-associated-like protein